MPYDYIIEQNSGGQIIQDIRDPSLGPDREAMWLGKWNMDYNGELGTLVIRRTREVAQGPGTVTRLGTYYTSEGIAHRVDGYIEANSSQNRALLVIDFDTIDEDRSDLWAPDDPSKVGPYEKYHRVNPMDKLTLKGQGFGLDMLETNGFAFGNFAAGRTTLNGIPIAALLSRPNIHMPHIPGDFSIDQWAGKYKVYQNIGVGNLTIKVTPYVGTFEIEIDYQMNSTNQTVSTLEDPRFSNCIELTSLGLMIIHSVKEMGIISIDSFAHSGFAILESLLDSLRNAGESLGEPEPISLRQLTEIERPEQHLALISMRKILEYL